MTPLHIAALALVLVVVLTGTVASTLAAYARRYADNVVDLHLTDGPTEITATLRGYSPREAGRFTAAFAEKVRITRHSLPGNLN